MKRVRTDDDSEASKLQQKLRSTFYHENVVAFLDWETDGNFNYYAFEKCGLITLAEYVKNSPYVEMSDEAMKIMCGLVDGVKHLHTKGLAHMNLNPHNILVVGDTVKICGMWNSKPLSEVGDGVAWDIHKLGHAILYLISDGKHDFPDVEDVATSTYRYPDMSYMNRLKSTLNGTNEEAWYLLEHLGFLGQTPLRHFTRLLLQLKGPVRRFVFSIEPKTLFGQDDFNYEEIYNWLLFLARQGIEELTIRNCFSNLLSLELLSVNFHTGKIWEFIAARYPLVESLKMNCTDTNEMRLLDIAQPGNLKKLYLSFGV